MNQIAEQIRYLSRAQVVIDKITSDTGLTPVNIVADDPPVEVAWWRGELDANMPMDEAGPYIEVSTTITELDVTVSAFFDVDRWRGGDVDLTTMIPVLSEALAVQQRIEQALSHS